jgi:hypothetical protein
MAAARLIFGACGFAMLALTSWAIRRGSFPGHGQEITRSGNPFGFWLSVGAGATMGLFFLVMTASA